MIYSVKYLHPSLLTLVNVGNSCAKLTQPAASGALD